MHMQRGEAVYPPLTGHSPGFPRVEGAPGAAKGHEPTAGNDVYCAKHP
jgi:hypothetical protein